MRLLLEAGALRGEGLVDDDGSADARGRGRRAGRRPVVLHRDEQVSADIVDRDVDVPGVRVASHVAHDLDENRLHLRDARGHRLARTDVDRERAREVGAQPALEA